MYWRIWVSTCLKMNKKATGLGYLFLVLIILAIITFGSFKLLGVFYFDGVIECFEDIAKDYCEEKNLEFVEYSGIEFICMEDNREAREFLYTKEERKECNKIK